MSMKLEIDLNNVIIMSETGTVNIPGGVPLPVRLERFKVVNGAIELDPEFIGMSNAEVDEHLLEQSRAEQLELSRVILLEYIRTKRAGKVIRMLKVVDNIVDLDNAGYKLVCDADKESYDDAIAGKDVFPFASVIAGKTQEEYRTDLITSYEERLDKKKKLLDIINGLGMYYENAVLSAIDNDELIRLREDMNTLLAMSLEEATPETITAFLSR